MWEFIMGIFVGTLITIISFKINTKKGRKEEVKYIRKGLYRGDYKLTTSNGNKKKFDITVEIGEIERTKNNSKITIIGEVKSSYTLSNHNTHQLKTMIEGWHKSSAIELEWFENHPSDERNGKIDNLLN